MTLTLALLHLDGVIADARTAVTLFILVAAIGVFLSARKGHLQGALTILAGVLVGISVVWLAFNFGSFDDQIREAFHSLIG